MELVTGDAGQVPASYSAGGVGLGLSGSSVGGSYAGQRGYFCSGGLQTQEHNLHDNPMAHLFSP